jgi:hypothetical protein
VREGSQTILADETLDLPRDDPRASGELIADAVQVGEFECCASKEERILGAAGGQARRNTMEVARRGGTLRFTVGVLARAAPGQVLEDGYAPGWTYSGSLVGQSTFKEPSPCSVKLRCPGGSWG